MNLGDYYRAFAIMGGVLVLSVVGIVLAAKAVF